MPPSHVWPRTDIVTRGHHRPKTAPGHFERSIPPPLLKISIAHRRRSCRPAAVLGGAWEPGICSEPSGTGHRKPPALAGPSRFGQTFATNKFPTGYSARRGICGPAALIFSGDHAGPAAAPRRPRPRPRGWAGSDSAWRVPSARQRVGRGSGFWASGFAGAKVCWSAT